MNIQPIKMYYVTSKDETTILYEETIRNKIIEKIITIKGKFKEKPTIYNVTKYIETFITQSIRN